MILSISQIFNLFILPCKIAFFTCKIATQIIVKIIIFFRAQSLKK